MSCSKGTGPPIADRHAELINGKINADFFPWRRERRSSKNKRSQVIVKRCSFQKYEANYPRMPNAQKSKLRHYLHITYKIVKLKAWSAIICSNDKLLEHREKISHPKLQSIDKSSVGLCGPAGPCLYRAIFQKKACLEILFASGFPSSLPRSRKPGKLLFWKWSS